MTQERRIVHTAQEIISKCDAAKRFWGKRNAKFKEWYSLVQMIDKLAQKNMESFVGNDPRASYNLVLGMLDQKIPHRFPPDILSQEQTAPASELSRTYDIAWDNIFLNWRMRGRYWLRDLIGFLLSTGWYSVFSVPNLDGTRFIAEVWNPASVYPTWDDQLIECAHIFELNPLQAKRLAARNDWNIPSPMGKAICRDYWWMDGLKVMNSIAIDSTLVKDFTHESRFKRIPIFISPVGGLPDTGDLSQRGELERWKAEMGQSVLASNENVYNYWNKWWTFSMQLLRDTAQARTYEKTSSAERIVKPEDWDRRGAHFKLGPQDEIGFIAPPPMPVEIRSSQLDMEAMMQRGGPSWAMFGNIQQQLTAYVMSQISASANQIAKAYHEGVVDCISDIDNFWLDIMKEQKYKPYGRGLPAGLPNDARLTARYEIKIPGDLVHRATTARILNPSFELSWEKVIEETFPEIKNPTEELGKIRAGKARQHPVHAAIALIESFKEEARLLQDAKDASGAALYEKAAALVEASMETMLGAQQPAGADVESKGIRPPSARPEVVPPPSAKTPV